MIILHISRFTLTWIKTGLLDRPQIALIFIPFLLFGGLTFFWVNNQLVVGVRITVGIIIRHTLVGIIHLYVNVTDAIMDIVTVVDVVIRISPYEQGPVTERQAVNVNTYIIIVDQREPETRVTVIGTIVIEVSQAAKRQGDVAVEAITIAIMIAIIIVIRTVVVRHQETGTVFMPVIVTKFGMAPVASDTIIVSVTRLGPASRAPDMVIISVPKPDPAPGTPDTISIPVDMPGHHYRL